MCVYIEFAWHSECVRLKSEVEAEIKMVPHKNTKHTVKKKRRCLLLFLTYEENTNRAIILCGYVFNQDGNFCNQILVTKNNFKTRKIIFCVTQ